ncbi:MAG TPA: phosphatidate cytidylyltransferase [Candidatus Limnocylindrales bacterium]|nr:phosphatidate cytidylyltransferase [Candidatus Limnocylindrales bacterium]
MSTLGAPAASVVEPGLMLVPRLLTAAVGIPLLAGVMWAGQPWLAVLIGIITLLAAVETGELLARAGYPPAHGLLVLFGVGAVALAASWSAEAGWNTLGPMLAGWLVLLLTFALAAALRMADGPAVLGSWVSTVAGATYVAMLAFLLLISLTPAPGAGQGLLAEWLDDGRVWLLIVVLTVWAYDSAAYAVGRAYGRGRFFNHISPNKTWSGAIGGTVAAVAAAAILGGLTGRPLEGAGLGLLVSIAAPVGDLAESALKRAADVKDSGRLFPGHGGMLDRVDAFVTVAPLAWLYLLAAGIA